MSVLPMLTPLVAEGGAPVVDPSAADGVFTLMWVVIALPLTGAAILLLGGRLTDAWGHLLGCATVLASFGISLAMFVTLLGSGEDDPSISQHLYD